MTKPWRFALYLFVSYAVLGLWALVVIHVLPDSILSPHAPKPVQFVRDIWGSLLAPAVYGVFAAIPLHRGERAGRAFLVGGAAFNVIAVTIGGWLAYGINGLDCRPGCGIWLPGKGYYVAVGAVSMTVCVVGPLLLAFVRWPKADKP